MELFLTWCEGVKIQCGHIYYAEFKDHGRPAPILNIFRVDYIWGDTLGCTPLVSNWNAGWKTVPQYEILNAHEVFIEDLPLYISWPEQSPAFHELLKKGLAHETPV
jgi:hypothetical protein